MLPSLVFPASAMKAKGERETDRQKEKKKERRKGRRDTALRLSA